jgi:hypothetical protein
VIEWFVADIKAHFIRSGPIRNLTPPDDPVIEAAIAQSLEDSLVQFAETEAAKLKKTLEKAIKIPAAVTSDDRWPSIQNFRDKYLAHLLTTSRRDRLGSVDPMRHGYEDWLFDRTIEIADLLHLGVLGSHLDWKDVRGIARRQATALWRDCKFDVSE